MIPFKLGVSLILDHNGYVLVGLRKGSHGAGTWGFPGGHMDPGEYPHIAAIRELQEETGIILPQDIPFQQVGWTIDEFGGEKRYVDLFVKILAPDRYKTKIMEPQKCAEWRWVEQVPNPKFLGIINLLNSNGGKLP